jgi:hypothetical protein
MPQASKKATSKKFKHGKRGEAPARETIEGDLQESELEEEIVREEDVEDAYRAQERLLYV